MSEAIIVALITSAVTLVGVYVQNSRTTAVIETKLAHLTDEVKKHNSFAERIPVMEEQIKVANNRIKNLEAIK